MNPKTAGISAESENPSVAGVPKIPKPNYVPSNQIALLPISIPNALLSQLQSVINGTSANNSSTSYTSALPQENSSGKYKTNDTGVKMSNDTKLLTNSTKGENAESTKADTYNKNEANEGKEKAALNKNDSLPIETELNMKSVNQSVSALTDLNSLNKNNSLVVIYPQSEDKSYIRKQTISPCKRSTDVPCYESKITTEGNSVPTTEDSTKSSKSTTISISPSMLIQKLIEHKEAEKSTPDPVVNIIPTDPNNKDLKKISRNKEEENKDATSTTTEVDINKLIKALTGTSSNVNNTNETKTSKQEKENSVVSDEKNEVKGLTTSNCSNARKRGFSLNFDCPVKEQHKGGSLSISPNELLQKLLGPKSKNDIDKKNSSFSACC